MQYTSQQIDQYTPDSDKPDCMVIPCLSDQLDTEILSPYADHIESFGFKGDASECVLIPNLETGGNTLLWGLGETEKQSLESVSKSAASLVTQLSQYRVARASIRLDSIEKVDASEAAQSIIKAIESKQYQFDKYKSKKAPSPTLEEACFLIPSSDCEPVDQAIAYTQALTSGMSLTRDLGNEPGNVCTPSFLAEQARELCERYGFECEVLDEAELDEMGMGAFVSVSKGSTEPGKLIIMKHQGGDASDAPHVLVGKGITFDTGGISLKPGAQMDEMKYDMCGAASVLGTMKAVGEYKPALNVIGVIATAENMPAGNASKPGDIVTTLSGQTVEILNTDAEGRLVLCDALTYVERFKPASVIDIATLTGACIIALGHATSAVMSNNDDLVAQVLDAGKQASDKAWQLPIWDEYQTAIDSPFADMQNIGGKGAGSITAACFLSRFTKDYPWAHLDIAGTAWVSGGKDKGATGRPVPLLFKYLNNQANA